MTTGTGLEVRKESRNDTIILHAVGDIDLSCSPILRSQLIKAQAEKPAKLIVDLSEVSYMDSSGVATLVEALKSARNAGTSLVICGLQERVRSIFEIARLDIVFTIVDDVDAALSA